MADFTDCAILTPANVYPFTVGVNDQGVANFTDMTRVLSSDTVTYVNRAYDSVAGKFVSWRTPSVDSSGVNYPGPGAFGVTTSGYAYTLSR